MNLAKISKSRMLIFFDFHKEIFIYNHVSTFKMWNPIKKRPKAKIVDSQAKKMIDSQVDSDYLKII